MTAISGAATLAAELNLQLGFDYPALPLRVAFETAASLTVLLAACLVFGRFLRRVTLTELALTCSLGSLVLSELVSLTTPVPAAGDPQYLPGWGTSVVSAFGAVLFALAAFVPHRRLRWPRSTLVLGATAVSITLLLIAVLAVSSAVRVLKVPAAVTMHGPAARPGLRADVAHLSPEAAEAAIYVLAAVGSLRRARQTRDDFFRWLALAAVLAAAACVSYLLYPHIYSQSISVADVLRLCSYTVLVTGSAREVWLYWRVWPEAAALEERRRIACDLHDGLAQELAYLLRSLRSLDGAVDRETTARLRQAAERAQREARLAISTLAVPRGQSVDATIAQAVGEVAARDHIRLELDIRPDIQLQAVQEDALVRIACEAVANAAHHSGAEHVSLSLRRDRSHVRLRVRDSGCGFDPTVAATGFGLISMRERANSVGGDLRISTAPGHGTEVEATI